MIEKITKSPNDPKDYLGIVLPNQLKVLLVSDSEADYSVGSLAVDVGQYDLKSANESIKTFDETTSSKLFPKLDVSNMLHCKILAPCTLHVADVYRIP